MSEQASAKLYAFEHLQSSAPPDPHAPGQAIAAAQAEALAIRERALQEGLQLGREQGMREGRTAVESAAKALAEALESLGNERERLTEALAHDAVELALELAGKVVHGTIEVQPHRVLDVVRDALRPIADRRKITVLVAPEDMEIVSAAVEQLRSQAGGIEVCEVQAERRVRRGGAIVRTSEGEVDATVQTQLEKAQEVVAAELGHGTGT